jgi:signal transduction histidine kinase
MNWRSITFRLVALYCGLLLVLGASFSLFTVLSFERYSAETVLTNSAARAGEAWNIIKDVIASPPQVDALIEQRFSPVPLDRYFRISVDGKTIYQSGQPAGGDFDAANIPLTDASAGPVVRTYGLLILYATRFVSAEGHLVTIESGQSNAFAKGMEFSLLSSLMIGLPILLFAAAAAGYLLIRRALSPVELMIQAAEAISFKNPRSRLPLLGTADRVEALGFALNRMLDRLDSAYQHANRFSSDAAHELRTPLAIIRGELEFALAAGGFTPDVESAIGNVLDEVDRLTKIVDSLLTLSRMDRPPGQRAYSTVDLHALAVETVEQMQLLAEEKEVTIQIPTGGKTMVTGDRDRLKQVLVNLLDNSIKYNVRGGHVAVDVSTSGDAACLTVTDTGIGIAPENHGYIFDRFYRVSTNRGEVGAGLGLAIVRSICHAHGGSIRVSDAVGAGTSFCVTLPCDGSQSATAHETVHEHELRSRKLESAASAT